MGKILDLSDVENVVYFHEFIYFVDSLDYGHYATSNLLKAYFICLLLVFDRILIPVEHINISLTEAQRNLKIRFMNSAFVRDFISAGRIIFTKWEVCSDMPEYLEAADRYMHEIGAKEYFHYEAFIDLFKEAQIYDRDQAHQSRKARDAAGSNGEVKAWRKEFDFLRYEDGPVTIHCSHEKAFVGEGREKDLSKEFLAAARVGYISAMPDGNGILFRSLVDEVETVKAGGDTFYHPVKKNLPVDPVLLKIQFLQYILEYFGFILPKRSVYENTSWRTWFVEFLEKTKTSSFKLEVLSALQFLSKLDINSESDFYKKIEYVKVRRITKAPVELLKIFFDWKNYLLSKFEAKVIDRVPAHNCYLSDAEIR